MWPDRIINLFEAADFKYECENALNGPFNALLDHCFPWENGWNVVPQYRQPKRRETIDFTIIYLIKKNKIPMFFMEIKPLCHVDNISTRSLADEQMRDRFTSLLPDISTNILHGISALGNRLSHYYLESQNNKLTPSLIAKDLTFINDTAPAERWNIDILNDEGYIKFKEIVDDVKQMSMALKE